MDKVTWVLQDIIGPDEPPEPTPEWELQDVELDGEAWNLRLFWNDRAERWQMDMVSADGTRAIYGTRMVPNWPLGWFNTGRAPRDVTLILMDFADDEARDACTYDGMGWRWKLCTLVDDGTPDTTDRNWTYYDPPA